VPSVQDDGSCGDRALSEERGGPSGHQHARDRVRAGSEDPSEALSRLSISLAGLATFDPDEEDRDPITVAVFDRIQALSEELVLWIPESEDRACFKAHCSNFAIWLPDHSTGHARLSYKSTQHPSRKGRAGFMRDMPRVSENECSLCVRGHNGELLIRTTRPRGRVLRRCGGNTETCFG
jgi:hypothetical protein